MDLLLEVWKTKWSRMSTLDTDCQGGNKKFGHFLWPFSLLKYYNSKLHGSSPKCLFKILLFMPCLLSRKHKIWREAKGFLKLIESESYWIKHNLIYWFPQKFCAPFHPKPLELKLHCLFSILTPLFCEAFIKSLDCKNFHLITMAHICMQHIKTSRAPNNNSTLDFL